MDKEIFELLKSVEETMKRLENRIDTIKEDLEVVQLISAKNWNDLIELKSRNTSDARLNKLEKELNEIHEKVIQRDADIKIIKNDLLFAENTISKNNYDIEKIKFEKKDIDLLKKDMLNLDYTFNNLENKLEEEIEKVGIIKYKIDRTDSDVIDIKNKIKDIENIIKDK